MVRRMEKEKREIGRERKTEQEINENAGKTKCQHVFLSHSQDFLPPSSISMKHINDL